MASEVSKQVIFVFCFSIMWMGVGIVQLPMFYPLVALEKGVPGIYIGLVLSLRPLTGIIFTPIINRYIILLGLEQSILIGGLIYSFCFISFAFVTLIDGVDWFITVSFLIQIFTGIAQTTLTIGEQCLLLRYSEKGEREKNLGKFRVASGLGGMISPILGSVMYACGGFIAAFMSVGVGYLFICPWIFFKL